MAVSGDCGTTNSQSATVTVSNPPTPPTAFSATSNDGATVHLAWSGSTFPAGFGHYQIQRAEAGMLGYADYVTVPQTSNDDLTVGRGAGLYYAYAYRIVAVDINGARSAPSVADVALVGTFTDDPLPVNAMIRGSHFSELRKSIDAVRATAGLDPVWASYAPPVGPILASHMIEMQVGLDEARAKLNLPRVVYTWPSPAVGQFIHRRDIEDVRTGVK